MCSNAIECPQKIWKHDLLCLYFLLCTHTIKLQSINIIYLHLHLVLKIYLYLWKKCHKLHHSLIQIKYIFIIVRATLHFLYALSNCIPLGKTLEIKEFQTERGLFLQKISRIIFVHNLLQQISLCFCYCLSISHFLLKKQ